jgi:hypothetical protein
MFVYMCVLYAACVQFMQLPHAYERMDVYLYVRIPEFAFVQLMQEQYPEVQIKTLIFPSGTIFACIYLSTCV